MHTNLHLQTITMLSSEQHIKIKLEIRRNDVYCTFLGLRIFFENLFDGSNY